MAQNIKIDLKEFVVLQQRQERFAVRCDKFANNQLKVNAFQAFKTNEGRTHAHQLQQNRVKELQQLLSRAEVTQTPHQ